MNFSRMRCYSALLVTLLAGAVNPPALMAQKNTSTKIYSRNALINRGLQAVDSVNVLYYKKPTVALTGPVNYVTNVSLIGTPAPSILTALIGRMPGLNITQNNGLPTTDGDGQQLTGTFTSVIRGYQARTGGGGTDLLVLIDGALRPYVSIAPEEIESISLLKDATSTVMLGHRSTPGLLMITTKKGKNEKPQLSFTLSSAIQNPLFSAEPLSAYEYASLYNQTQINNGVAVANVKYSAAALKAYQDGSDPYLYPNVNWQDAILKDKVGLNKANINLQGSGNNIHYFVSLDYLKSGGIFKTADFNNYNTSPDYSRYSIRSNIGVDFTKTLKLDVGLYGRIEDQTQPGNFDAQGILNTLLTLPALAYSLNNPNGTFGGSTTYGQNNLYARAVRSGYSLQNDRTLSFDLGLTKKLDNWLPGLYVKGSGNINVTNAYRTFRNKTYAVTPISSRDSTGKYIYGSTLGTNTDVPNPGTGSSIYRQNNSFIEGQIGYDHQTGNHNINGRLVANRQYITRNDDLPYIYNTLAANVSYDFKQKYYIEVAGSYGSFNQFAPGNRYEPYYAFGLGWNLAKESFIQQHASWITLLKPRVNYGKTGYVNRSAYNYFDYIQRYGATGTYYFFGTSAASQQGYAEAGLANTNAHGEKAHKLDVGMDISLFQNHLAISADYFKNNLYDIWTVPGAFYQVIGIGSPAQNIGKQRFSGMEYTLNYNNNTGAFHYFVNLNLSTVNSKLEYVAEAPLENAYQYYTGQPVGILGGLTALGIFRSQTEINNSAVPNGGGILRTDIKPGDIKYLDRNGDGIIDNRDAGPIGSSKPLVYYGASLGFSYKGLDVSMLFQGVQNRQVYLAGDYEWAFRSNGTSNAYRQNLDAYSAANPNGQYPRLTIGANANNEQTSSFWLHNANFLRLRNAEVGYTLPSAWTSRIRIPAVRLFVNGLNLFTISQFNDFGVEMDPEVQGSAYPLFRTVNFGANIKL